MRDQRETHTVIAGHSRYGSCDPNDARRQQWFAAGSQAYAERLAERLRSGEQKMKCPYCNRFVKASLVRVHERGK